MNIYFIIFIIIFFSIIIPTYPKWSYKQWYLRCMKKDKKSEATNG
jgi:hypothetical protein